MLNPSRNLLVFSIPIINFDQCNITEHYWMPLNATECYQMLRALVNAFRCERVRERVHLFLNVNANVVHFNWTWTRTRTLSHERKMNGVRLCFLREKFEKPLTHSVLESRFINSPKLAQNCSNWPKLDSKLYYSSRKIIFVEKIGQFCNFWAGLGERKKNGVHLPWTRTWTRVHHLRTQTLTPASERERPKLVND